MISTGTCLIEHLMELAKGLIQDGLDGGNRSDFASEFHSYWHYGVDSKVVRYWSAIQPKGPTREIVYWNGNKFVLLAENSSIGNRWLRNFFGEDATSSFQFQPGLLLWLPSPLYPENYPANNSDLLKIANTCGDVSLKVLTSVIKKSEDRFPVLFGFDIDQGPALAGSWISPPTHSIPHHKSGNVLTKGFRPGRVPAEILANRYLTASALVDRRKVQRCDRTWIHTRGGEGNESKFSHKKVVLVGCGAIGSEVAQLLARGGVGHLVLIDHDQLTWDNVGRHSLGGPHCIDMNKADAVARNLLQSFPHLEIRSYGNQWQEVYEKDRKLFRECDVILSTTGDWSSDAALNLLTRQTLNCPPVIFGWGEAYGCAGHALAALDIGGCLACGMDEVGLFLDSPIKWEATSTMKREPGCGGFYQPFGAIAMSPINSLIASVVVDLLQGKLTRSHHRVWLGHLSTIEDKGGRLDENWITKHGELGLGEKILRFDWPVADICLLCKG